MALLPFSLSYLIMTPGRVRLPGEPERKSSTPPSPTSQRWSTEFAGKARARAVSFSRRLSTGPHRASKASKSPSELECLVDENEFGSFPPMRS